MPHDGAANWCAEWRAGRQPIVALGTLTVLVLVLGWAGRAARPLTAAQARPLIQRGPTALWKIALLVYRLVFLPR